MRSAAQGRYTAQEIQAASGIQEGDNLLLLNKHSASGNISEKLPYIEEIRIHKRLPDTLEIEVRECTAPVAVVQDNITWLISAGGKSGRGKIVVRQMRRRLPITRWCPAVRCWPPP